MSAAPAPGSPAPSAWLGKLRSWWRTRRSETGSLAEDLAMEAAAPAGGPVRVLVVDDDPENLSEISALMASRGLVPVLAADGAEAVALASEVHFDLILMDLQMPILDGLGATTAIRRFENRCARPAVPVVAYSQMHASVRVLAFHGLNGRLSKPCTDQELEDCLVLWCPTYRSGHRDPARQLVPGRRQAHQVPARRGVGG